jgi:hypothetical protein
MAGGTPANPATYEKEPGWFLFIGGRFARACLSSGISMGLNRRLFLHATMETRMNKVMAGGTPANPAALVG